MHIIHRGERPLEQFDSELVDLLVQKSEEIGIHVHLNAEVKSIRKQGRPSWSVVPGTEPIISGMVDGSCMEPDVSLTWMDWNWKREGQL